MRIYYAHTHDGDPEKHWERLKDHLVNVETLAGQFAQSIHATEWAQLAGLWHDLGKYSDDFQDYLLRVGGAVDRPVQGSSKVDHSTAGAQHAVTEYSGFAGQLLAYCIAGHHTGLPDATDTKTGGLSGLKDRLKKPIPSIENAPRDLLDAPSLSPPKLKLGKPGDRSFQLSVFCRMLFSCLVDADFLATEQFMRPDRTALRPTDVIPLAQLLDTLNGHLAKFEKPSEATSVNKIRRAVLASCREKATLPTGLFSLTVPTGGGKTLSSLAFALTHAEKHKLQRVIYAIPFTSIIEQTAGVFREALATSGDHVVLEHHSNFERSMDTKQPTDIEENYWDSLASENWDAPLIVTTNVQLFESLFANRSSRCRKLHRIANSVIILDEVQTLPVNLLRPTLAMLDELCRNYGCSVVLCSATQPAVTLREGFSIGLQDVREIIDDAPAMFSAMKRVAVERVGDIDDDTLALRLAKHDQVLCIVNTKQHAADLFRLLTKEIRAGVFHLSTNMCARHRVAILRQVRSNLDDGVPCRVISTQLIEAGVDIDFPVVYRAMTGVDSIAQAAGRCNREGRESLGKVYVFDTNVDPRGDLRFRRQVGAEVAGLHEDLLSLDAVEHYFNLIYWSRKDDWDKKEIMNCFRQAPHFQFRKAASEYRLIDDTQQPVIVPYDVEGERLIDELRKMKFPPGREFSRKLQRLSVGVYQYQLNKLCENGVVTLYHDKYWALDDDSAYDEHVGLRIDINARDPGSLVVEK